MTRHHRRAHLPADRPTYVPVTTEQLHALRAVARVATTIAAEGTPDHDVEQALAALPHVLDDLALADSHAERVADAGGRARALAGTVYGPGGVTFDVDLVVTGPTAVPDVAILVPASGPTDLEAVRRG